MRKVTLRRLIPVASAASRGFSAVLLTGPRRSGKTTLLQLMRPKADYRLLEDPDSLAQVHDDPRGFLDGLRFPVILDEIQNAPGLVARALRVPLALPALRGADRLPQFLYPLG
jgi:predicted AAA+ superfamily ATPase